MYYPPRPITQVGSKKPTAVSARTLTAQPPRHPSKPLLRKYEAGFLWPDGTIADISQLAPASDLFESAFAAIARGTLIATPDGPRAIEDLWPGDVITASHNSRTTQETVLWKGTLTLVPNAPGQSPEMGRLTRLPMDSFGMGRPAPDLMLGPKARVLQRGQNCTDTLGTDGALVPVRALIDGMNVIEVMPPSPVQVYHIALKRYAVICANGMGIETYHPGQQATAQTNAQMLELYLSFFPHITRVSDFGPLAYPRIVSDGHSPDKQIA